MIDAHRRRWCRRVRPRGTSLRGSGPARPDHRGRPGLPGGRDDPGGMVRFGWGVAVDHRRAARPRLGATARPPPPTSGDVPIPRGRLVGGSGSDQRPDLPARHCPRTSSGWARSRGRPSTGRRWTPPIAPSKPMALFQDPPLGPGDWVATQAAFVETCVAAGYGAVTDHNAPDAMGAGALPFNQDDRVRWSPAAGVPDRGRPGATESRDPAAYGRPEGRGRAWTGGGGRHGRAGQARTGSPPTRSSSRPARSARRIC